MTKLRCFCRERGRCICLAECHSANDTCDCIKAEAICSCIMYPASTENAPAYLIGKDERQLDL